MSNKPKHRYGIQETKLDEFTEEELDLIGFLVDHFQTWIEKTPRLEESEPGQIWQSSVASSILLKIGNKISDSYQKHSPKTKSPNHE